MNRRRLMRVLRVLVSVALLTLLFLYGGADLPEVAEALRGARLLPLGFAALCYVFVGTAVRGFRWQALVTALGQPFRVRRATELFLVGTFFNQFLPTAIGGDLVRTLMLGREGMGAARAASTVLVDRVVGIVMLLAAGLLALVLAGGTAPPRVAQLLMLAVSAAAVGSFLLLTAHRWRDQAARVPLVGRLASLGPIARFVDSFAEYDARQLAISAAWSTAFTAMLIAANASLGLALGIDQATMRDWVMLVPLVALSSLMPSVGGWGPREWTYVGLLGTLNPPVPPSQATAISILFGGMNLVLAAVGGFITFREGSVDIGRILRSGQAGSDLES